MTGADSKPQPGNDSKPMGGADNKPQTAPSAEDLQKAQDMLQKLNSKDPQERRAAEEQLDQTVGRQQREQLQQDLKDLQSQDPKRAQAARDRLKQQAKQAAEASRSRREPGPGGQSPDTPGDRLQEDAKNRLKTAELQLKTFEEAKKNQKLLEQLGYTPEQFEAYLKSARELVERRREEAAALENSATGPRGPATVKVSEGAKKPNERRPDGTAGPGAAGSGTAPPGYSEAQRRFAEEAAKLKRPNNPPTSAPK